MKVLLRAVERKYLGAAGRDDEEVRVEIDVLVIGAGEIAVGEDDAEICGGVGDDDIEDGVGAWSDDNVGVVDGVAAEIFNQIGHVENAKTVIRIWCFWIRLVGTSNGKRSLKSATDGIDVIGFIEILTDDHE